MKTGRPSTLPPLWAALAAAFGGVGKLAIMLDVDASTLRRWSKGSFTPSPQLARAIVALARFAGVRSPITKAGKPCKVPA